MTKKIIFTELQRSGAVNTVVGPDRVRLKEARTHSQRRASLSPHAAMSGPRGHFGADRATEATCGSPPTAKVGFSAK